MLFLETFVKDTQRRGTASPDILTWPPTVCNEVQDENCS